MDSQGRFYFSMVNQPGPSIVRISADGTACDYVTRVEEWPRQHAPRPSEPQ
jgi:hypothetical protein